MATYPPPDPVNNTVFNPYDFIRTEEAAAAGAGVYVEKAGDTMTGTLTVPNLVCTGTVSTNILDATTTIDGDIITLNQTGAARANSLATYGLTVNPKSTAASGNTLVQLNDHALLFTNGANESGALTIGPFSATSKGMRMDGTGDTSFQNNLTVLGDVVVDQNLQVNGVMDINKIKMEEVLASNNTPITAGLNSVIINPNTSAGAALGANGLVQANDSSIIFTQGTQNGACGLVVGPYTSTTRGFRMDGSTDITTYSGAIKLGNYLELPNNSNPIIIGATGSNARTIIRSNNTTGGDIFINVPNDAPNGSNFLMTGGAATISGAKTFSTAPTLTATSNQLAIQPNGSGTRININAANPAGTRQYTLPDAGTAANFIMSEGTSLWTNTARIDVPNQRVTLGSPATHTQKVYIYASSASGNRLVIGESSTESRGMISTNISNSGTYGIDSDISDATRMIGLTNTYSTNQAASRGCAINFQNLGLGGTGNTGRTYNDFFVNREVANQSSAAFYFNGFDPTFSTYYTNHRLGYQLFSFIGGKGNAGVVLNSNTNPTGVFMMGSTTPKVLIGDGSIESTGGTFVTGALHCGGQFDIQKLNWRIPIYKFNAVTSGGAKTYAIFSPVFTSTSVNFMIYVKFNLMVEILDPTRIQANNNMSSSMVTYEGTYYYNPSSSTQGLVDQTAVKQTDINVGVNRTITAGSCTITNSGTIFSPVFNLNITLGGASIATSNISIAGDVHMDINSTSGYMTTYS